VRGLRSVGLLGIFVGAQIVALLLAVPFQNAGLQSTSNPNSPLAPLYIIVLVIAVPLVILALARRQGIMAALRVLILALIAGSLYLTLSATFALLTPAPFYFPPASVGLVGDLSLPLAAIVAAGLFLLLLIVPTWYVVDLVGFLAAGSLIALLGISFGILPAVILLVALAVYDYIAVYRTKHMISLAEVVTDMKLPILLVMPSGPGYDYAAAPSFKEQRSAPVEEREATFMGLGDVVIPGTMVVSAFIWLPTSPVILGIGANVWGAAAALVGSLIGYAVLMRLVARGNAQAGLPFLNGGALAGFAIAYLLLFHNFTFGLTG
jgi:presenilin-like A22 family membrane protease